MAHVLDEIHPFTSGRSGRLFIEMSLIKVVKTECAITCAHIRWRSRCAKGTCSVDSERTEAFPLRHVLPDLTTKSAMELTVAPPATVELSLCSACSTMSRTPERVETWLVRPANESDCTMTDFSLVTCLLPKKVLELAIRVCRVLLSERHVLCDISEAPKHGCQRGLLRDCVRSSWTTGQFSTTRRTSIAERRTRFRAPFVVGLALVVGTRDFVRRVFQALTVARPRCWDRTLGRFSGPASAIPE